ncbi:MAG: SGNH/GDSL hydrolase family protein [Phycisphaerae bacterium]
MIALVAAVSLNQWTIGYLATKDGTIDEPVIRWAIGLFEVVLLLWGLWLLMRRRTADLKAVAFRCIAVFISIVLLECVLRVVHVVEEAVRGGPPPKYMLSPYQGKEWAYRLFTEADNVHQQEGRFRYHPLLGWDTAEFHGEFVNVDANGVRRGWNPELPPGAAAPSIYVFGGSTTWGVAVRDEDTIPSRLSKLLNGRGHQVVVYNYGDIAYSFIQEVVNLMLLLKAGHRPDWVVFYDGVNDTYAAYRDGVPGSILDLFETSEGFGQRMRPVDHFLAGVRILLVKHCMIYHYLYRLCNPPGETPRFAEVGARLDDDQLRDLAEGIADYYATSYELLEVLAQAYGFQYLAFWQPVSLTEDHLFEEEKTDFRTGDDALRKTHLYVRESLKSKGLPNFYDISDVLRDRTKTTYIDYCHLTVEGNAVVAARIGDVIEAKLHKLDHAGEKSSTTHTR